MKRLNMKKGAAGAYISLLAGVLFVMFMLRQCSSSATTVSGEQSHPGADTLNIAIDYSPMSMYMIDDTLGGFNYDLLRELAADNGLRLKFHPVTSLDKALSRLDSGYYDIVVADLPTVADYDSRILFTEPIFLDRSVLVQQRDSTDNKSVNSVLQLAGKSVMTVAGSPVKSRLLNLGREIGDTIYVTEDSIYNAEQLVMLVSSGDIKLAVVNEGIAKTVATHFKNVDISTSVSFTQFQSWLMSPHKKELRDSVNSMLTRFKQSPRYDRLLERYHVSRPPDKQNDINKNQK